MVSIIIPVYNASEYLERCVESVINQNYSDKEIILVDDGSTDDSGSLCDKYAEHYPDIHVIHKKNGGLMSAWMAGVEASRGSYLCFVDSDDWIEHNMLQEMAKYLTGSNAEIVACNYTIDAEGKEPVPKRNQLKPGVYEKEKLKTGVFPQLLGNENRMVSFSRCMKLISRELYENNMKFCNPQIRMAEDVNIMFPVLLDTVRLVVMKDAFFYHYYFNPNSMVHKYDAGLYRNIQNLQQAIIYVIDQKCDEVELQNRLYEGANREYIYLLMLAVKNEARGNKGGYYKNIINICKDGQTAQFIRDNHVQVREKSNKLIYNTMRHPNFVTVTLLRLAMIWYYRKAK